MIYKRPDKYENPTYQYIFTCLKAILPGKLDDNLASNQNVDWAEYLTIAQDEKIAPLLYAAFKDREHLPDDVLHELTNAYQLTKTRNILLLNDLKEIINRLKNFDYDVLVLKGAGLIAWIYDDIALRPFADLDLLVHRKQIHKIIQHFLASGFTIAGMDLRLDANLEFENEILLSRSQPYEINLEVHWTLFDSLYYQYQLSMDYFWESSQKVDLFGLPIRILGLEAQILHLSSHLVFHHTGYELLWVYDLALLLSLNLSDINWDRLMQRAVDLRLSLPLRWVIELLSTEQLIDLPDSLLDQIQSIPISKEEERVYNVMREKDRLSGQRFIDDLGLLDDPRAKLRFIYEKLFPSIDYMRIRYKVQHPGLLPFYYPYRWYQGLKSIR